MNHPHFGTISDKINTRCKLTHWGRETHICVGKLTNIGSDNGLSPARRQAIIWTNAGILLIGPLSLASTRALTRTGNVAEMNYDISEPNPRQTQEKCSIHRSPGQYHDCLRIVCGQSWECPRIQSGMVRNATECADRSQTVRTHLGSHQES